MTEQEFTEKLMASLREYVRINFEHYYLDTIMTMKNNELLKEIDIEKEKSFEIFKNKINDEVIQLKFKQILDVTQEQINNSKKNIKVTKDFLKD